MHKCGICEERGSGYDKIVEATGKNELLAPRIENQNNHFTKVILFAKVPFELTTKEDRMRNTLGNIRVVDFKTSHVRTFFSALSDEELAHSTIKDLYGLLNPSFELAVEDGIIRKNPVTGTLGDYGAPAKEKEALTLEQQEKLLKFVEQSNVYKPHLPMMQVMLGACLRVSETIGLT